MTQETNPVPPTKEQGEKPKWTPEPWKIGDRTVLSESEEGLSINGAIGEDALKYYGGYLIGESISSNNAERIVACVNNCKGFTTQDLETLGHYKAFHDTIMAENEQMRSQLEAYENLFTQVKMEVDELKIERDGLLAQLKGG